MKFKIDIDCTPAEARAFFGLPDLEALNKAMAEKMQERMLGYMDQADPQELMQNWMAGGMASFERMRDAFMTGFQNSAGDKSDKKEKG